MSPDPPFEAYSRASLPKSADVVIVGGGIVGVCSALFLARRGMRVCLCEKGRIACEQSSRNWGWVRQMGRDPVEMPLAIESLMLWRRFETDFGIDTGFRQTGITYLCRTDNEVRKAEAWARTGREFGLPQAILGPSGILKRCPGAAAGFRMGLFTSSDGGAEPDLAVPAMAGAAARLGVRIVTGCAVRGIETSAGQVTAALTEKGVVSCDRLVVAGGAWSRLFLGNLAVQFPQLKVHGTAARIGALAGLPEMPVGGGDFAFRRRLDGGFTVALRNTILAPVVPDSFRLLPEFLPLLKRNRRQFRVSVGRQFINEVAMKRRWQPDQPSPFETTRILDPSPARKLNRKLLLSLRRAFPAFSAAKITTEWAGMIDVTPDEIPVVGRVSAIPGLFVASGFSGHGFGIGPGAGKLMAQLIVGDKPCVDPHPFRMSRFESHSTPSVGGNGQVQGD